MSKSKVIRKKCRCGKSYLVKLKKKKNATDVT